ncbi:MAG: hypothetical protein IKH75_22700 [Ruminococcus sp.]|nr:hypothetical protein [Ruminococcus sp.]
MNPIPTRSVFLPKYRINDKKKCYNFDIRQQIKGQLGCFEYRKGYPKICCVNRLRRSHIQNRPSPAIHPLSPTDKPKLTDIHRSIPYHLDLLPVIIIMSVDYHIIRKTKGYQRFLI